MQTIDCGRWGRGFPSRWVSEAPACKQKHWGPRGNPEMLTSGDWVRWELDGEGSSDRTGDEMCRQSDTALILPSTLPKGLRLSEDIIHLLSVPSPAMSNRNEPRSLKVAQRLSTNQDGLQMFLCRDGNVCTFIVKTMEI
uniref:Uncharacterized protein n=1 Tax=Trypanosoma congolense (strain IL3000) TaxID=1068625 RepID=G0UTV1_TRYCI|nr:hypothetical protein, unlikely [Trypanosoma congolense IL3000]